MIGYEDKILIDTCSYLRLAKEIHPLLNIQFDVEKNKIFIIKQLETEFLGNSRLKNKFTWFMDSKYLKNRENVLNIRVQDHNDIDRLMSFLRFAAMEKHLTTSEIDTLCVAVANTYEIPLISDDTDLITLADEFSVKIYKSLEILKKMLTSGFITVNKVTTIVEDWLILPDKPSNLEDDLFTLFKGKIQCNKVIFM